MTNREVIEKLLNYHPLLENYDGCDGFKAGNPDDECTGVAASLVPTVEVIKKAAEMGCNLLIVHEPTFYTTPDFDGWKCKFENEVYQEKKELIEKLGITIFRDHDHMHAHEPDSIFTGVEKYLGWSEYRNTTISSHPFMFIYDVPRMTVAEMAKYLKEKISINGMRVVGRESDVIKRVAIVGHLYPNSFGVDEFDENGYWHEYATDIIEVMENGVDAIIPGEVVDWTVLSYVRDAVMLGKNKAVFNIGHFAMEELGMLNVRDYMTELVGDVLKVEYIHSGNMYQYNL